MPRILAGLVACALLLVACGAPGEGERCNPLLFQTADQCLAGLACVYPAGCGVAYCCAAKPSLGQSPNCNTCAIPGTDAGTGD